MTLNDAHIFSRLDQLDDELDAVIRLIERAYGDIGIGAHRYRLSVRSPEGDKWAGDPEHWRRAEASLEAALTRAGVDVQRAEGEAAFYGPKIDVQVDDAFGREFTLSTVQIDFWMPERFDLTYVGPDGTGHRPVMIHRSLLSTAERLVAFLLEVYQGAMPFWLAPQQVALLPVGRSHEEQARVVAERLADVDVRCYVLDSDQPLGGRVRAATATRVPYVGVLGDKELAGGTLAVSVRGGGRHTVHVDEFVTACSRRAHARSLELEPLP